jgi:RHS repeat-associated protein
LYYQYDGAGNLTNLASATSNGVSLTYQYDAMNRLTNVIDNRLTGTKNTAYTFDGAGNLQTLKYPTGITNLWQYDSLNRLTNLSWKLTGSQRGDFAYKLGAAGNRTNLVDNINGTSRTFNWSYDNSYRLTSETVSGGSPTGTLGYVYDDVGNRTSRTGSLGGVGAVASTFDVNDFLDNDSTTNNGNAWFDANGNQRTNGATIYLYDYANRLTNANSAAVVVTYDADGNRVRKVVGSTTTLYLVATVNPTGYPQVVEELTVSGGSTNLAKVYTHGPALISQRQISGPMVTFYGFDGLGSVRFLTDTNGAIANTYAYDAYGTLIDSSGTVANSYLYTGEQYDSDLGMYYLRTRLLNVATGRFLTRESYEGDQSDPSSLHKYVYCANNPANRIDPGGNIPIVSNFFYGNKVHEAIYEDFKLSALGVRREANLAVSTIIGVPYIPVLTAGRPDLIQYPASGMAGEIYEIKPAGSFIEGQVQLQWYLTMLNALDPQKRRWNAGSFATYSPPSFVPIGFGVFATVSPPIRGVILYQVIDLRITVAVLATYYATQIETDLAEATLELAY